MKSRVLIALSLLAATTLAYAGAPAPGGAGGPGGPGAGAPGGPPGAGGRGGRGQGFAPIQQGPPPASDPNKRIDEVAFGQMRDGTANRLFVMRNKKGSILRVMTYGATIQSIEVPDKDGKISNVVLTTNTFNQNFGQWAYTVGRVANRIAGAKFTLEGKEYQLEANDGQNTLHSGRQANFGVRAWEGKALPEKPTETSVQFTMNSKDGDGGYPGNLTLTLTYTLTDDDQVKLEYEGKTDKTTLLAPTNHAYFNLSGSGSVMEHELWIDADKTTAFAAPRGGIPSGELAPVAGTPNDFTQPGTKVGSRNNGAYDVNFVLNNWQPGKTTGGGAKGPVLAARVTDPTTGRVMEVKTDQPGIQLYTGAANPKNAICLETQHFPDAIHHENFPSVVLKPGETYKSTTIYAFSVKK